MKKNANFGMIIASLLFMAGCSEEVRIDEDMATVQGFGKVYIPQANYRPLSAAVTLTENEFLLKFNVFYGGMKKAEHRIPLSFVTNENLVDDYNEKYGTNYAKLPEASYEMPQSVGAIESGQNSTPLFNVVIKPKGYLEPFKPYLLPIRVQAEGTPVNEALQTVYFEVIASFGPGEVPRENVLSLGGGQPDLLIPFVDNKLVVRNADGRLQLYTADDAGIFGSPTQIGEGWQIFNQIFYFEPNRMVGIAADVVQYQVDGNGAFGNSRTIGWGWNIFEKIFPYKHFLIGVRPDGLTTAYPYNEQGDLDGVNIRDIASDWNRYKQLFAYGSSLLGIEADGTLWQIPMSETNMPQQRVQLGSGWDMYESVVASGTDLLAIDESGDLWRYKFEPRGFWPLEAE